MMAATLSLFNGPKDHGPPVVPQASPAGTPRRRGTPRKKSRHPSSKLRIMGRLITPGPGASCVYSQKRQMRKRISKLRGITTGRQWVRHRKAMQRANKAAAAMTAELRAQVLAGAAA